MSDPWVDLGGGLKVKLNFFRTGIVAYQIKGNQRRSNMQHGSKYFARRPSPPPPPRPWGSKGLNSTFSDYGHIAYKIKGNHECSNMAANILLAALPLPPDPRVKRSNLNFAEHDHVAYQIKGNRECSNMVANILPAAPISPQKVKIQLF